MVVVLDGPVKNKIKIAEEIDTAIQEARKKIDSLSCHERGLIAALCAHLSRPPD